MRKSTSILIYGQERTTQHNTTQLRSQYDYTRHPRTDHVFQLIASKGYAQLGMKSRGKSALYQVKALGIKARTASEALPIYVKWLEDKGLLEREQHSNTLP